MVALIAYHWIPGLTLAGGFVLGAIVSPPDAAAATAIAQRLGLPRRIVTILEGESLVNDAMGLVLYQFAVAAVVTGAFSLPRAIGQFFYAAIGGIALGLALGWLAGVMQGRLRHVPTVEILFSLLVAFAVYLAAEAVHVSGVLATVTAGRLRRMERAGAALGRDARAGHGVLEHRHLPAQRADLHPHRPATAHGPRGIDESANPGSQLLFYAGVICAATILIRMIWIFPAAYLPRLIPAIRRKDPLPPLARAGGHRLDRHARASSRSRRRWRCPS